MVSLFLVGTGLRSTGERYARRRLGPPLARTLSEPPRRTPTAAPFTPGETGLAPPFAPAALTPFTAPLSTPAPPLQQFGPGAGAWLIQVTQRLGTAFHGPRLTTLRAVPDPVAGDGYPEHAYVPAARLC